MLYVLLIRSAIFYTNSITFLTVIVGLFILISLIAYSSTADAQSDNSINRGLTDISSKGTMETFDMTGSIAGLIYTETQYGQRVMAPEILSGKWDLQVIKGKVNRFAADFEQIEISGSAMHNVKLTNFTEDENSRNIQLTLNDTNNIAIRGTVDVIFDQNIMKKIPVELFINKLKVIEAHLYISKLGPFRGKPITGVIH